VYTPGVLDDLKITGTGTATLTGFDPTPAFWALTAQQPSGGGAPVFSFSATLISTVVPLPGALPLFATGLLGLVMLGRRRMKQKKLESAAA
jgi:hypothetical protein